MPKTPPSPPPEAPHNLSPMEKLAEIVASPESRTFEYLRPAAEEQTYAIRIVAEAMQEPAVLELQRPLDEAHDQETLDHSARVAVAAVIMGQRVGLSSDEIPLIAKAGLVHDVGKADPEIQPYMHSLDTFEGEAKQKFLPFRNRHPDIAANQIMATELWEEPHKTIIADAARAHHAFKVEGSYGRRPASNLLIAQTLALADTLDGEASVRGYKPAFSELETRTLIAQDFDADPEFIARALGSPPTEQRYTAA